MSLLLIWDKVTKINNVDFSLENQINVQSITSQVCIMTWAYTMSLDFRCCFSIAWALQCSVNRELRRKILLSNLPTFFVALDLKELSYNHTKKKKVYSRNPYSMFYSSVLTRQRPIPCWKTNRAVMGIWEVWTAGPLRHCLNWASDLSSLYETSDLCYADPLLPTLASLRECE